MMAAAPVTAGVAIDVPCSYWYGTTSLPSPMLSSRMVHGTGVCSGVCTPPVVDTGTTMKVI